MKYLVLLGLLIGCAVKPLYYKGDCVRVYSSVNVSDYLVIDLFKDKYVFSPAFKDKEGTPVYASNRKYVFTKYELEDRSKKISCTEVE